MTDQRQKDIDRYVAAGDKPELEYIKVEGFKFDEDQVDYSKLIDSYFHTGLQATKFALVQNELDRMLAHRYSTKPVATTYKNELYEFDHLSKSKSI